MKISIKWMMVGGMLLFFIGCKKNNPGISAQKTILTSENRASVGTFTYTHDGLGRMETANYSGNASNPPSLTTFKTYDGQNRLVEASRLLLDGSGSLEKSSLTYNAEGKIVRIDSYMPSTGPLSVYTTYQYNGNNITEEFYTAAGTLINYTVYRYNPTLKNIVQIDYYDATGVLQVNYVYSNFDSNKTNDALFPPGYGSAIAPGENNYQTLTKTVYPAGTVSTQTFTYEYNSDGYVTKRTSGSGLVFTFTYAKQ